MESKTKLKIMMQKIEKLRSEMVLSFLQNGADISNPQVLRLSQLLDDQLNKYDSCKRDMKSGSLNQAIKLPLYMLP